MDPKYSIIIFLALVAAAAAVTFPDGLKQDTELINYDPAPFVDYYGSVPVDDLIPVDGEKEYVGTTAECPDIDFTCLPGYERFEDEEGCGCV